MGTAPTPAVDARIMGNCAGSVGPNGLGLTAAGGVRWVPSSVPFDAANPAGETSYVPAEESGVTAGGSVAGQSAVSVGVSVGVSVELAAGGGGVFAGGGTLT
jgi:hypothetical protein